MYRPKKIIVIGGNAAGPSAAAKAKRVNPDADVILFESNEFISTGTCELPYLFSGEISDYSKIVFYTPDEFCEKKGVKVFNNHHVKQIDIKYKEISVIDKRIGATVDYDYDKLIIATGSVPNELPNLPFFLDNVFSLKSVTDYIKIKSYLDKSVKNILVIGSGYIGLEAADSLNKAGYNITIYEKENLPLPASDSEVQSLVEELLNSGGIKFLSGEDNVDFIIESNKFTQLKYNGRYIDFDAAIVCAGVKPNIKLAEDAGIKIGILGGIMVDNRLKTSDPNIFAAGDVIEIKNQVSKQNDLIPLATHAHGYGHIAGENAAGGNKIAEPVLVNSVFKLLNRYIAQVGLTEKKAWETTYNVGTVTAVANNKVPVMPNSSKIFGKIIYDKSTGFILGASFVGSNEVSGYADLISALIHNKIKAFKLADINYNYTPPLSPFVNILSILGRKIKEKV